MSKEELGKVLANLEEIRSHQTLLDQMVISTHINSYHIRSHEFERVMNKFHDHVTISGLWIEKAIGCIKSEMSKETKS